MDTTETTSAVRNDLAAWFEIPATDFERACRFYETLLDVTLQHYTADARMAVVKYRPDAAGGAIAEGRTPSADGVTLYLQVNDRLESTVERIETAGGRRLGPIVDITPNGRFQLFLDSEGNRVGLHSER
jgi:predicted enzyme related to lactoylglutathione lyase